MMCYELGQRPIDIRNLKWTDIDGAVVTITQSKRGATVELPVPDNLMPMLEQQREDWDFQDYVVPHHRPQDSAYRPLTVSQMTALLREVKAIAGLPDELQVGDLRKTAIVEMIEGGVDHLAIQSVSGHKNVASLNPYNKFSLNTAKAALERRQRLKGKEIYHLRYSGIGLIVSLTVRLMTSMLTSLVRSLSYLPTTPSSMKSLERIVGLGMKAQYIRRRS